MKTNNHIYLGETPGGQEVFLPNKAENLHISITGMSGFGKSTLLHLLEIRHAREGDIVIAFNFHDTHSIENVHPGLRTDFNNYANFVNIQEDGIPFPLWMPAVSGKTPSQESEIYSVLSKFEQTVGLGDIQAAILEEVLQNAYSFRSHTEDQLEPIRNSICLLKRKDQMCIKRRLSGLLKNAQIIPRDVLKIGKINILDISDYDEEIQKLIVNLMLCMIKDLAKFNSHKYGDGAMPIYLFLDEYVRMDLKKHAPLGFFLTESRKFNVGMILATQDLDGLYCWQRNVIEQAATKIYFQQTDAAARKLAKVLYPRDQVDAECARLQHLPRGNFLLRGRKNIGGGTDIDKPLIVHNVIPD